MLMLTVRVGERVLLETKDGMVVIESLPRLHDCPRIGITAPESVTIVRENAVDKRPRLRPSKTAGQQ